MVDSRRFLNGQFHAGLAQDRQMERHLCRGSAATTSVTVEQRASSWSFQMSEAPDVSATIIVLYLQLFGADIWTRLIACRQSCQLVLSFFWDPYRAGSGHTVTVPRSTGTMYSSNLIATRGPPVAFVGSPICVVPGSCLSRLGKKNLEITSSSAQSASPLTTQYDHSSSYYRASLSLLPFIHLFFCIFFLFHSTLLLFCP